MKNLYKNMQTPLKRGKTRVTESWLVLVLHLIGWVGSARFLDQSQSEVEHTNEILDDFRLPIENRDKSTISSALHVWRKLLV